MSYIGLELARVEVDQVQQPSHSWPCFPPHSKLCWQYSQRSIMTRLPLEQSEAHMLLPIEIIFCFSVPVVFFFLSFVNFNNFLGFQLFYSLPFCPQILSYSIPPPPSPRKWTQPHKSPLYHLTSPFPGFSSLWRFRGVFSNLGQNMKYLFLKKAPEKE